MFVQQVKSKIKPLPIMSIKCQNKVYCKYNTSTTLRVLNLNRTSSFDQSVGLSLIFIVALSFLSSSTFKQQDPILAQKYIDTIKYKNLVIDLDDCVKT